MSRSEDQDMDVNREPKKFVILLLGETGCGKSTFINALSNYLIHNTLEEAANDVKCVIKAKYQEFDNTSNQMKIIELGVTDDNESDDSTESGTQRCRCHVFDQGQFVLKVIDTPGIGDTRGVAADKKNLQNLLYYIAQYKELNAICVLMKPNQAKVNVNFKYCLVEMLRFLNKNAADNIIFLFSHSRGTHYELGDTGASLLQVLKQIGEKPPHVNIDLMKEDIKYFFDNDSFRYLMKAANGLHVSDDRRRQFQESWDRSVKECQRLFQYICKLKPHQVLDTISINNVRKSIRLLTKPLVEINENIARNIKICGLRKKEIEVFEGNIKELMDKLFIPVADLEYIPIDHPVTVCGDKECCKVLTVEGVTKTNYKQKCHPHCYLDSEDNRIVGNEGLLECQTFYQARRIGLDDWFNKDTFLKDSKLILNEDGTKAWGHTVKLNRSENCFGCGHSYRTHLHIRYETRVVSKQIRDESIQQKITTNTEAKRAQELFVEKLRQRINEMTEEKRKITECLVRFMYFLANNAITAFNDAYEEYLRYLINNGHGDQNELWQMHFEYIEEKDAFEQVLSRICGDVPAISPERVHLYIEELYGLKHFGQKIKDGFVLQYMGVKKEMKYTEVKHNIGSAGHSANKWFN